MKIRRPGHRAYTFSLHGRNPEIDSAYIRAACEQLGIDPVAFKAELG